MVERYTEAQKRAAVRAVITQGSFKAAGEHLGMPHETIAWWKHDDREWWDRVYAEISLELLKGLSEASQHLAMELRELILGQLKERLANGDYKLNVKTGEVVRVPVQLTDMTKTFVALGGQKAEAKPAAQMTEEERLLQLVKLAEDDRAGRAN